MKARKFRPAHNAAPQTSGAANPRDDAAPKVSFSESADEGEDDADVLFEKKLSSLVPVRPSIALETELEFELSRDHGLEKLLLQLAPVAPPGSLERRVAAQMSLHTLAKSNEASVSLTRYVGEPKSPNATQASPSAVSYIFPNRPLHSSDTWNRPLWWSAAAIFLTTVSWGVFMILDAPINFQDSFRNGLKSAVCWIIGRNSTANELSASKAQPGNIDAPVGSSIPLNQKDDTALSSPKEDNAITAEDKNSTGVGRLNYHSAGVLAGNGKATRQTSARLVTGLEAALESAARFESMIPSGSVATFLDALAEGRLVDVLPPEVLARLSLKAGSTVPNTQTNSTSVSTVLSTQTNPTSPIPGTAGLLGGLISPTSNTQTNLISQGNPGLLRDALTRNYSGEIMVGAGVLSFRDPATGQYTSYGPGTYTRSENGALVAVNRTEGGQLVLNGVVLTKSEIGVLGAGMNSPVVPPGTQVVPGAEAAMSVLYQQSESGVDFLLYEQGGEKHARFSGSKVGLLAEGKVPDAEALVQLAKAAQVNKAAASKVAPEGD